MKLALVATLVSVAFAAPIIEPEIRSWEEAAKHEKALEADPADLQARKLLLAWYTRQHQDARTGGSRLKHILRAIEHHPDMRLSDSRSFFVDERDTESFNRVREAWLAQVETRPGQPVVLLRAANALAHSDPELATGWLKKAIRMADEHGEQRFINARHWWSWPFIGGQARKELARLYADAIVGVVARTPWEGTGPVDPAVRESDFARAARREIDESNDGALLVETAWWLHLTSESFHRDGRPETGYAPLAWKWLQRAEQLDNTSHAVLAYGNQFQRYWSTRLPDVVPAPVPRVRLVGDAAPQPIETVDAVCPPEAGIPPGGASVNVALVIATDGTVRFATLQGGSPGAIQPALDAARQWRFPSTYRDDRAVEVETQTTIPVCGSPPN